MSILYCKLLYRYGTVAVCYLTGGTMSATNLVIFLIRVQNRAENWGYATGRYTVGPLILQLCSHEVVEIPSGDRAVVIHVLNCTYSKAFKYYGDEITWEKSLK